VKDLSRLGRDLEKTIIIDFDKRIFGNHLENGIECRWKGGQNDRNLLVLGEIFEEMVTSGTNIQDTLTFYAEELLSIRGY
jgi:TFIIF-interacting CTD phosphatase-like protein